MAKVLDELLGLKAPEDIRERRMREMNIVYTRKRRIKQRIGYCLLGAGGLVVLVAFCGLGMQEMGVAPLLFTVCFAAAIMGGFYLIE